MSYPGFDSMRGDEIEAPRPWEPTIVCLCGSTKFKEEFIEANKQETKAGKIVLTVGYFGHAEGIEHTPKEKKALDTLHRAKVRLANEVLVIDVGRYIGKSTRSEIREAKKYNKSIRFWSQEKEGK